SKRFAGDRGDSLGDVASWIVRHPASTAADVFTGHDLSLVVALLLTTGGLCLLAPRWMLLGLPALSHNVLSAYSPPHRIGSHYYVSVGLAFAIAAAAGVHRLTVIGRVPRLAFTAGVAATVVTFALGIELSVGQSGWTADAAAATGGVSARRAALA